MYIHPLNNWENDSEITEFIQKNPFATLVSRTNGRHWATHLPFVIEKKTDEKSILHGHLAKANPQWKFLENHEDVLVIFQGPHAYISSSWYNHENVPTWNYLAVHVYGKIRIIKGKELMDHLTSLVDTFEAGRPNRVHVHTMTNEYLESQVKALVGIEVIITDIQASAKLSQNRDMLNFNTIIKKLGESPEPLDHRLAEEMGKRGPKYPHNRKT